MEPPIIYGRKAISTNVSVFLRKVFMHFRRFNCNRELIKNCWRSHRESTFVNSQLSLGTKGCLEAYDLRVLETPEICSSLTNKVLKALDTLWMGHY